MSHVDSSKQDTLAQIFLYFVSVFYKSVCFVFIIVIITTMSLKAVTCTIGDRVAPCTSHATGKLGINRREGDVAQWLERLTASPIMHVSLVRGPLILCRVFR